MKYIKVVEEILKKSDSELISYIKKIEEIEKDYEYIDLIWKNNWDDSIIYDKSILTWKYIDEYNDYLIDIRNCSEEIEEYLEEIKEDKNLFLEYKEEIKIIENEINKNLVSLEKLFNLISKKIKEFDKINNQNLKLNF